MGVKGFVLEERQMICKKVSNATPDNWLICYRSRSVTKSVDFTGWESSM